MSNHFTTIYNNPVDDISGLRKLNIYDLGLTYSDEIDFEAANEYENIYNYIIYDVPQEKKVEIKRALPFKVEFAKQGEVE